MQNLANMHWVAGGAELANRDLGLLKEIISTHLTGSASAIVSRRLMQKFGRIGLVLRATADELAGVAGVDRRLAKKIRKTRELIQAVARADMAQAHVLDEPELVFEYCRLLLAGENREQFHALYLDRAFRLIAHECIQIGTVDHVTVYPREVLGAAIKCSATALVLVHNHPSGNAQPSAPDIAMTRQLASAGRYLRIDVADHIIVGDTGNFSFRQNGLLPGDQ